jgi:hypothetical protein
VFSSDQVVFSQHQVQDQRQQQRGLDAEPADAGEAIVRNHLKAAQSRRSPHCTGKFLIKFILLA